MLRSAAKSRRVSQACGRLILRDAPFGRASRSRRIRTLRCSRNRLASFRKNESVRESQSIRAENFPLTRSSSLMLSTNLVSGNTGSFRAPDRSPGQAVFADHALLRHRRLARFDRRQILRPHLGRLRLVLDRRARQLGRARLHDEGVVERVPRVLHARRRRRSRSRGARSCRAAPWSRRTARRSRCWDRPADRPARCGS